MIGLAKRGKHLTPSKATTFVCSYGFNFFYTTISQELGPKCGLVSWPFTIYSFAALWNNAVSDTNLLLLENDASIFWPVACQTATDSCQQGLQEGIVKPAALLLALGILRRYYRNEHESGSWVLSFDKMKELVDLGLAEEGISLTADVVKFVYGCVQESRHPHGFVNIATWTEFFKRLEHFIKNYFDLRR